MYDDELLLECNIDADVMAHDEQDISSRVLIQWLAILPIDARG